MKEGWTYKKLGEIAESIYALNSENQTLIDEIMEMVK